MSEAYSTNSPSNSAGGESLIGSDITISPNSPELGGAPIAQQPYGDFVPSAESLDITESFEIEVAPAPQAEALGQTAIDVFELDDIETLDKKEYERIENMLRGVGNTAVDGTDNEAIKELETQFADDETVKALNEQLKNIGGTALSEEVVLQPEETKAPEEKQEEPQIKETIDYEAIQKQLELMIKEISEELSDIYKAINEQYEDQKRQKVGEETFLESPVLNEFASGEMNNIVSSLCSSEPIDVIFKNLNEQIVPQIRSNIVKKLFAEQEQLHYIR